MKRFFLLGVALFSIVAVAAQDAQIFRSEFVTYDKREDAAKKLGIEQIEGIATKE